MFAIIAGAFVPLNFVAVRLAQSFTHPRVLGTTGGSMPGAMRSPSSSRSSAMALLFVTLWKYEMTSKHASMQLRALRAKLAGDAAAAGGAQRRPVEHGPRRAGALMPALPLDEAGKYVAGAYVVFVALILIYVAIMAVEARAASSAS